MPEFPKPNTQTESLSFNPNVPIVHWLSSVNVIKSGFIKKGTVILPNSQTMETTYMRGDDMLTYNGATWKYKGCRVEFLEDLK